MVSLPGRADGRVAGPGGMKMVQSGAPGRPAHPSPPKWPPAVVILHSGVALAGDIPPLHQFAILQTAAEDAPAGDLMSLSSWSSRKLYCANPRRTGSIARHCQASGGRVEEQSFLKRGHDRPSRGGISVIRLIQNSCRRLLKAEDRLHHVVNLSEVYSDSVRVGVASRMSGCDTADLVLKIAHLRRGTEEIAEIQLSNRQVDLGAAVRLRLASAPA